jgi:hypothetical protein
MDLFFGLQTVDFGLVTGFVVGVLTGLGLDMRVCSGF